MTALAIGADRSPPVVSLVVDPAPSTITATAIFAAAVAGA